MVVVMTRFRVADPSDSLASKKGLMAPRPFSCYWAGVGKATNDQHKTVATKVADDEE